MPHTTPENPPPPVRAPLDRLASALSIRPGEGLVTLLSGLTIFVWFLGWGMVRPLRDAMGVEKGADYMLGLISATAVVSLAVSPVVAWTVSKLGSDQSGRRRIPLIVYRFFALNLLLFALAKWLTPEPHRHIVGYVFFVWSSVFNMTCVSVFWGLVSDVFPRERSLRLYGLIAMGATLGIIVGGATAKWMAGQQLSAAVFMLALAAMLEVAARLSRAMAASGAIAAKMWEREAVPGSTASSTTATVAPLRPTGAMSGIKAVVGSPYLLGVCGYLLIYTITSSFFYLAQQRVVAEAGADQAARTAMNATISLWADSVTLIVQLLLTGRIIKWIGQSGALASTPIVTIAGLAWMGQNPGLVGLTQSVVTRRSVHFAVDRPSREALYTVIPPEQKYTAKSFIDTYIYRCGDVLGALIESGLKSSNTPMLWFAGPLCVVGAGLGMWLGARARNSTRAEERSSW